MNKEIKTRYNYTYHHLGLVEVEAQAKGMGESLIHLNSIL